MSSARRPRSTENGLREYPIPDSDWPAVRYAPLAGMAEIDIPGCDPGCEHEWGEEIMQNQRGSVGSKSTLGGGLQAGGAGRPQTASEGAWCQKCGGWRGQLGREPTIEMYVGHLVHVLRLVKRVLRDDGTLWLNLGDSSMASAKGNPGSGLHGAYMGNGEHTYGKTMCKPENTMELRDDLTPEEVAYVLSELAKAEEI